MREIVETGTDVAAVAVGDPSLLADLRACKGRQFEAVRSRAVADGALWRVDTGADGSYLLYIFVNEEPPAELAQYLEDPIAIPAFRVPSGRLLVAGEECFVGALSFEKAPHMGREVAIPAGTYSFTAYRSELPETLVEDRFAAAASPAERTALKWGERMGNLGCLASIAAMLLAGRTYSVRGSLLQALAWLAFLPVVWGARAAYCRRASYRSAEKLMEDIQREWPGAVVVMRRAP